MNLKPVKNKSQLNRALKRINELWGAKRNTEKGDELDILMLLVEKFEEEHYPTRGRGQTYFTMYKTEIPF